VEKKPVAPALDPSTSEAIQARLRFYRDLGLTEFYRRPVDPALLAQLVAAQEKKASVESLNPPSFSHPEQSEEPASSSSHEGVEAHEPQPAPISQTMGAPGLASETWDSTSQHQPAHQHQEESPIPPRKPISGLQQVATPAPPQIAPAKRAAALQLIRDEIGDCTRCKLHQGRNKIVFGDGDPNARLMFVGEGPGADEDAQGLPFVGKAGQLLNNMIVAMGLQRDQVYIANVVKCRPPGNRVPEPDEGSTCTPFLFRQIDVIRPEILVALGATAATWLLGQRQPLAGLRGRVHAVRGTKLIVTYHPAYLLRDPRQKKEAWADLQIAMRELGLKPPKKS
jgi:uracil-DNA glycosylase